MSDDKNLYTIIVPVLNITTSLVELTSRIQSVMNSEGHSFEIIFIDDGSTNVETLKIMKDIQKKEGVEVTIISFFKNFGQQAGILAGINNAKGNYLITMDGDLEHRPEDLPLLIKEQANFDHDVVFANFTEKTHGAIKKFFSTIYTTIERKILKYPKGTKRSAFWIMKKEVGEQVLKFNSLNPSLSILIIKVTNKIGTVEVPQGKRDEGESAYTVSKLIYLASSLFINNSGFILRSYLFFGLITLGIFISTLVFKPMENIATIWLLFIVIPLIVIGFAIIGEYLFRIIQNVEKQPLYLIREIIKKD
ncbi:glycosyltransferase [bacterium]|nr:glycosyltransferase [bacterium]|tara:strand:- start:7844 stop:8761 length:918 start_codon:yes stop_codon:yes gene_type:complete